MSTHETRPALTFESADGLAARPQPVAVECMEDSYDDRAVFYHPDFVEDGEHLTAPNEWVYELEAMR